MAKVAERVWRNEDGTESRAWQVVFTDQYGKRIRKQFKRRKDADAYFVKARAQVQTGTFTPESASATVGEAVALWLERAQAEQLEAYTLQQYRQLADHILKLMPTSLKLAKLSAARVEQFRDDQLRLHSRSMARKILGAFKSVLNDARRRGLVAQNVASVTTIGANGRHKRRLEVGVDIPTPAELRAMLAVANPKAKAIVSLAALAGLRAGELRGLRWADVQLGAKPAVTVTQRADKGGKIGSPKSATSRRTVPLGGAANAVREWRMAQPAGRSLVFGTDSDKPEGLGNLQRRLLTPLCAKAGCPKYSWHSLRHYAISSWLTSRGDLKTVQHWAGHSTLTLTLDTYGHLIPRDDDHQRIEAAEQALFGR